MLRSLFLAAAAVAGLSGPALAAGAEGEITDVAFPFEGPFGKFDQAQLQRGLQVYQAVCANCHGVKLLYFRNLGDPGGPGLDPEQVRAFAAQYEVTDAETGETRPARLSDRFPPNLGAGAPDLSLMAKARVGFHGPAGTAISPLFNGIGGPEYIYSLLTGYTGEEKEEAGAVLYQNRAFPGGYLQMAQPLYGDDVEFRDGTPATIEQQAEDVAAFLMWVAEPKMMARKEAGVSAVLFLGLLAVLLYYVNRKLWAPIKRQRV